MSKSSTNLSAQLPRKSAWARGPPQTSPSPHPRSPAPSPDATQPSTTKTHSRRPSARRQGVSIEDGVRIPPGNVGAIKQGSVVTFGSIDYVAVPTSSSRASVPIKVEDGKSFGSAPAAEGSPVNGWASPSFTSNLAGLSSSFKQSTLSTSSFPDGPKDPISLHADPVSASPTSKLKKTDIRKLFRTPSTAPPPSPSLEFDASSTPPRSSEPSGPSGPRGVAEANGTRLNTNASVFVPKRITIKTQDGKVVDLENLGKVALASDPAVAPLVKTSQERRSVIRMETVQAKNKRLAEIEKKRTNRSAEEPKKAGEDETRRKEEEREERVRKGEEKKRQEDEREKQKERFGMGEEAKRQSSPLGLSGITKATVPTAQPSAFATARIIEDLGHVCYPDGIMSPKAELNVGARKGKFRYDRDFLLQFMAVCKEQPKMLLSLDTFGLEPRDRASLAIFRDGSVRQQNSPLDSTVGMPRPISTQASVVISGFKAGASTGFNMGNFVMPPGKTSEERFTMSSGNRVALMAGGGPGGMPFGRPVPAVHFTNGDDSGGSSTGKKTRTRSKRGKSPKDVPVTLCTTPNTAGFELVQPLEVSANRWVRWAPTVDPDSLDVVTRKVKSLLNKLTMEKFESISNQIIAWANKSEKVKDGRTLILVTRLIYERAINEVAWSEIYAHLCRKMMEQISPDVQDEGIKTDEGKPIAGSQLFRKYLLNCCQEDFERGWAAKNASAATFARNAAETSGGPELYSDEYHRSSQKDKCTTRGSIRFVGELYKLQMLTELIMHECIKKLLGHADNPEEEKIESLCRLLATVGQLLDNVKTRQHMDIYFSRMKGLSKNTNISPRMQFMLQDLIELRERRWVPRNRVTAPVTIATTHKAAVKERLPHDTESSSRTLNMSHGRSRHDGGRGGTSGHAPGSRYSAGSRSGLSRPPPKAGSPPNSSKTNRFIPTTFGPTSVFNKKDAEKRALTLSKTNSDSNMFSMLREGGSGEDAVAAAESSRPSKTRVEFYQCGISEIPTRREKWPLLPGGDSS